LEKKVPVSTLKRSTSSIDSKELAPKDAIKFVPGEPFTVSADIPVSNNKQEVQKATVVKEYRRMECTVVDLLSDDSNTGPFSTNCEKHKSMTTITSSVVGYGNVHKVNENSAKEINISDELKRLV
jgi:hypothetical protein